MQMLEERVAQQDDELAQMERRMAENIQTLKPYAKCGNVKMRNHIIT